MCIALRTDSEVPDVPEKSVSKCAIKKYKKLGRAIIINNEDFGDYGEKREGTDVRLSKL